MNNRPDGGEFDERGEEHHAPLLPREDRLWRHPSELSADAVDAIDAADVRIRWLAREPTRATAWTAGLVGALVATGIVLVGTHLGSILKPTTAQQTADITQGAPISLPGTTLPGGGARGFGLGSTLSAAVQRIGSSTVSVEIFHGSTPAEDLGVVVGDGTVVTAAAAVRGATSILVTVPNDSVRYVGTIDSSDATSGLALLHVNRMAATASAKLADSGVLSARSTVLAVTGAGGADYAPATLTSVDMSPQVSGHRLVDVAVTDLAAEYAPLGSPVLDAGGLFVGMVVGTASNHAVVAPSWLVDPVVDELNALGSIEHGWMGINGQTIGAAGRPAGVRVMAVAAGSAASRGGIHTGDVIESIDDAPVHSISALQAHLYVERPGTVVSVGLVHNGMHEVREVTLAPPHS